VYTMTQYSYLVKCIIRKMKTAYLSLICSAWNGSANDANILNNQKDHHGRAWIVHP
jgi:hypothetical protein